MDLNILFLAIVQGVTELLPISSSGHLIIFGEILKVEYSLSLIVLLHAATLAGIVLGYWPEIVQIIRSSSRIKVAQNIIISCIPAVLAALLLEDLLDRYFYNIPFIVAMLIFFGVVMIVTEHLHDRQEKEMKDNVDQITMRDALFIGLLQVLALFPGTSRSGITTLAGIWTGIRKDIALQYSFIVGIPIIGASFLYKSVTDFSSMKPFMNLEGVFILLAAFLVSLISIFILKKVSKMKFLTFFGVYRIVMGVVLLLYLLLA